MKEIICLEGLSGSGKTSLLQLLSKRNEIDVVEELLLPLDKPMDQEYVLKNDKAKFEKAYESDDKNITIVDRGYASTLANDFALIVDNPQKIVNSVKAFEEAKSNNLMPTKIIYIDISCETSLKRKDRPISDDIWTQIDYLKEIQHFYDKLMHKFFHSTEIIRLDGNLSIEEIYRLILKELGYEE